MNDQKESLVKRNIAWREKRLEKKRFNKKTCRVYLRCTENEKAFLEKATTAFGYPSITEYILESSLFLSINYLELDYLSDFTVAINRLNNNINQIARNLNRMMRSDTIDMNLLNQIKDELVVYRNMIKDLLATNGKLQKKINSSISSKESFAYNVKTDYRNSDMDTCPCFKEKKENGNSKSTCN